MRGEKVKTGNKDIPEYPVKIRDCGELTGDKKLTKETANFLGNYTK